VTAIEDLSLSVPRGEIFCLLGRNGAAKSTTLSAIARLVPISGGTIRYANGLHLGIASQKDILWDELDCKQHIALWRAIKSDGKPLEPDLELLARCDLAPKVNFLSKHLSGGQKRKLQLACALAGGSDLLLLDEITSGLDPLSRRAIWKLITANRGTATIILTTHCE
jgi:ATP-binding cassette subfamily A (ABC1) protein 3